MRTLFTIALFMLFLPLCANAQQDAASKCETADKVVASAKAINGQSPVTITHGSDCILMLQGDDGYEVLSYDISTNQNGLFITEHMSSALFTALLQARFTNLEKDSKVFIENIVAKGPDGKVIKLKPASFVY
jgi:hypothetical protein